MGDRNNIVYHIGFIIIVIRKAIYRLTSGNNRCKIRLLNKERGKRRNNNGNKNLESTS